MDLVVDVGWSHQRSRSAYRLETIGWLWRRRSGQLLENLPWTLGHNGVGGKSEGTQNDTAGRTHIRYY